MLKALRRKKLMATPLPEEWRQMVAARDPFYRRLPEADRHELEGHMQVFLAEKQFEGCGEFVVNEEHKHLIASQACLLLLHRHTDYFPDLQTILIYPALYVVPTTRHVGGGVMEQRDVGATIGVILDGGNLRGNTMLVAAKVHLAVLLFVPAATMPDHDFAVIVTAASALFRLQQSLLRLLFGDVALIEDGDKPPRRRVRIKTLDSHRYLYLLFRVLHVLS